jgi:hypothetical protein
MLNTVSTYMKFVLPKVNVRYLENNESCTNRLLIMLVSHILDYYTTMHDYYYYKKCKKVKLSLYQAVEAHRVVRRRGSHIFSRV